MGEITDTLTSAKRAVDQATRDLNFDRLHCALLELTRSVDFVRQLIADRKANEDLQFSMKRTSK